MGPWCGRGRSGHHVQPGAESLAGAELLAMQVDRQRKPEFKRDCTAGSSLCGVLGKQCLDKRPGHGG